MPPTMTRTDLAALCARLELEDESAALLRPEQDERAFVRALLDGDRLADAVRVMAALLPVRESIWWAWSCARRTLPPDPPATVQAALDVTERWIAQPTEENRRPAYAAAEGAGMGTPAGAAALAAFLSGGSVAPPTAPVVPPPADASARAVAGSVMLAAASAPADKAPERFRLFVSQAMEVMARIQLWPPA